MERGNDEDGKNIRMFNGETGFKAVKREVTVEQDLPELGRFPSNVIGEILQADYQKYFYCPKVSREERHIGHEMPPAMFGDMKGAYDDDGQRYAVELDRREGNVGNNHPTVKPIELMKYLIKLITPPGGTVLDPFNGSGSTGCAAVELGYNYIGCELDPVYVEISEKRIDKWFRTADPIRASGLFEVEE
jgi:DNA modification methylase